ncbi:MAG TPA: dihydroorotase [Thermaerobacter sp.]
MNEARATMNDGRKVLIRGGRVIDPAQGLDGVCDVLLAGGRVEAIGEGLGDGLLAGPAETATDPGLEVIDARGLWVVPGLIDVHVHLRTPGETHKETLATGTAAAAAGGFTSVICMPNTRPPLDDPIRVEWLRMKAEREALVRVYPAAAATQGLAGEHLTPYGALREAGAVAVTDDGRPIARAGLMRRVLEYAAAHGLPVLVHAEEPELSAGGAMHEGAVAAAAGMPGIPDTAESVMVARDLLLAERAGAHLHVLHVSAESTASLIRWAKARGVRVTAEVTPHHLLLCDEDVAAAGFDPNWKMNPPLRSAADREALLEAVLDGTIDLIATDHAPHHASDKDLPFPEASFGIVGLETAVGLLLDAFVPDIISPARLVELLSLRPAQVFGLPGGTLRPGAPADVTLIDPDCQWVIDPAGFQSLGRNTPFAGRRVRGRVVRTLVGGRTVYELAVAGACRG